MKKIHYTDNYLLKPYHPVTVFIIGAGGTGSQVVTNLARMNAALQASGHPGLHVTVFDPDTVSQANIGRQLFSETELGLNKAVSLVTRINCFFGYAWTAEPQCFPTRNFSGESIKKSHCFLAMCKGTAGFFFHMMILLAGNYSASMMALNAASSSSFFAAASASVAAVVV